MISIRNIMSQTLRGPTLKAFLFTVLDVAGYDRSEGPLNDRKATLTLILHFVEQTPGQPFSFMEMDCLERPPDIAI